MRTRESFLPFFAALLAVLTSAAPTLSQTAVPLLINYQRELTSPTTGEPVPDGSYNVLFRICDAQSAGTVLWQGTHLDINGNAVEVSNGIFSVILGSGSGNAMDASIFDGPDRWLEIRVGAETLSPRQRITSVAYAVVSENSRLLGGNKPSDFIIQALGLRLHVNRTSPNIIGGHGDNAVTAGAVGATVSGGSRGCNTNSVTDSYGTVGGGANNQAGDNAGPTDDATYATVGGGASNIASGYAATVGGGQSNTASGPRATVGGGRGNTASGFRATVGGGYNNTASGECAMIGGGYRNTASGYAATVAGGWNNTALRMYSFAAGRWAKANHDGCFVWGDSYNGDVASTASNQFIARASGGVRFYSNTALTAGVRLSAGSSSWSSVSDKGLKRNIRQVDGREILSKLAQIPISRWSYEAQDPAIEHIGPMAQDFYAAFGLGEDDKHISTVDADGVALAAIQGLCEILREKDAEIAAIKSQNAELQERLSALEKLLEKLSDE